MSIHEALKYRLQVAVNEYRFRLRARRKRNGVRRTALIFSPEKTEGPIRQDDAIGEEAKSNFNETYWSDSEWRHSTQAFWPPMRWPPMHETSAKEIQAFCNSQIHVQCILSKV